MQLGRNTGRVGDIDMKTDMVESNLPERDDTFKILRFNMTAEEFYNTFFGDDALLSSVDIYKMLGIHLLRVQKH